MFLKQLKIKNYRLFDEVDIYFQEGMNVLIGKNSTGKSTILEAIDFLLSSTINVPIEEIIPYKGRSNPNIQVYVEGIFEMSEIEKESIIALIKNQNEIKLMQEAHFNISYIKTIIRSGEGFRIVPNIKINRNGLSKNNSLLTQIINYLLPKLQTNNILKVVDQENSSSQQPLLPLNQLMQLLPHQVLLLNQYIRNMLYKTKQENLDEFIIAKKKIIDAYPEVSDLNIEFDSNRAQLQIYFLDANGIKIPLESEGLGIREYFYLFLILYYFPDTVIIKDEAFVHMHKSLLHSFIIAIDKLRYQLITTSHIKELITTLDFGNLIICRKCNGETIVKNLMQENEMSAVLDELGYSLENDTEISAIIDNQEN